MIISTSLSGLGFIGGGSIMAGHEVHPIGAASLLTFGKTRPWGSAWKRFVHENAARWTGVYVQCNTLPYENTWVDLDPETKDPMGDPVCRITSGPKENELRAAAYVAAKAEEWLRAAGAIDVVTTAAAGVPPVLFQPTPQAARVWATTRKPTLSTNGASLTKCRIWVLSERPSWGFTAPAIPPVPCRRWPGVRPITW